jgi:tetratricopeptide (TPR) repeat protein
MLETIRDYAVERLEDSGEGPVIRGRRDDYFLTLAEHAGPELPTDRQSYWLPRLDAEAANLRVVVASALENGHPDVVCRLATSLWRYWEARDRIAEARRLIEPGIEREAGVSDAVRAQALFAAGRLAARQGDHAAARSWFAAGVRNAAEDDCVRAQCLSGLGWIAVVEGDEEKAERLCEQSLALARSSCDALVIADSLNNLGASTYLRSPETARAAWEESLALRRQIGDLEGVTASLGNLAQLALREGDLEHATVLARESQSLAKERGDLWTIGMSSLVLATVSIVGRQVSEAWRQVRRALEVGDAAQHKSLSAYALALAAACFALEARDRDAARLEGAAEALDPSYDVSRDEPFQVIGDSLSSSRERLGEGEWLAAHEAGKHLGVREALGLITDASPWA